VRILLHHARAQATELARYPAFLVPTVALPAMFFLLFATPRVTEANADLHMALYAGFAVLGVAFFQFGVGIASERTSAWERFLRVLPVSPLLRFGARLLVAFAFALASALLVVVAALATTEAGVSGQRGLGLLVALGAGGVPMALLGIALGYWTRPRAALPIANLMYLLLAYAGGLWTGLADLPRMVGAVSPYLPTRQWGEVLAAAAGSGSWPITSLVGLAGYSVVFGGLALAGYRRDEGERFT
jgi:ABC-2 type transport system permease protein